MNINMLMQQAQRMQKEVESNAKKAKEELAQTEVHAEAGGGLVKVTMTCRNVVKRIEISPELLQDDADMIEDLIAAAMNDAARQAEAISEERMKSHGFAARPCRLILRNSSACLVIVLISWFKHCVFCQALGQNRLSVWRCT